MLTRNAPCKINLMLAITGVRDDGFHDLVSLVAPVDFCDTLGCEFFSRTHDRLFCDMPGVPCDENNLVMRATKLFRERVPALPPLTWHLQKRVPHGAGLGGGSSDAATALKMMNEICDKCVPAEELLRLGASLGSDVPLFFGGNALVMRGRGERVETLNEAQSAALRERKFLLFKPAFGVSTAEVYGKMRREGRFYVPAAEAEKMLGAWLKNPTGTLPLFNNMELPVFEKYLALPTLFEILRERFGVCAHMSGSGSACFVEITENSAVPAMSETIRAAWGESAFVREVSL